ncbi:MAG: Na(+)/H(+) antiporter subunit B [Pseudomonadota bacterium]
MRLDVILRITSKLILPFILLFALYVHFHGDFGPGGGFQAGVIAAGMLILFSIIFGVYAAKQVVSETVATVMVPLGILIYASAGIPALLVNQNYLNFSVLSEDTAHGQHIGILWVEVGVLTTVAGSMISIFYALVQRGRS